MAAAQAYPVRVDASLDAPLSRWLWLVKWVLVIPHYVVLAFLWAGFIVLSAVAMVAIVVTGRYPRAIFEFNVGVLRWTWRVQYYAIGAFGTDRYPPFTLAEDPSYPAHLEVDYPQRLSRGLALVKWWLLAIPQYIIVGLFTGSGLWFAWQYGEQDHSWAGLGLIGILAVIAAVVLLVTGRYPEQIFDFVLGMNRWVLRVAGYAGLMTDEYPPFRLDMGGHDPGTLTLPPAALQDVPAAADPPPANLPPAPPSAPGGWTGGRIVSVVAGAVLVLCSIGAVRRERRRAVGAGQPARRLRRSGHRHLQRPGLRDRQRADRAAPGHRRRVRPDRHGAHPRHPGQRDRPGVHRHRPGRPAARYLAGVDYATVRGAAGDHGTYTEHAGSAPAVPPRQAGIWTRYAAGPGTQTLTWAPRSGDWMVVAMNADGSRPVSLQVNVAATLPALPWIAAGLLIGGIIFLGGGVLLIAVPLRLASRH